jgi:hypothetical protein
MAWGLFFYCPRADPAVKNIWLGFPLCRNSRPCAADEIFQGGQHPLIDFVSQLDFIGKKAKESETSKAISDLSLVVERSENFEKR